MSRPAPEPELNIENVRRVRDRIAGLSPELFDMRHWGEAECGTAGCIGGWAEAELRAGPDDYTGARALLGLDRTTADNLFYMENTELGLHEVTIPMAVRVLDHLIETGEVDWSVARASAA